MKETHAFKREPGQKPNKHRKLKNYSHNTLMRIKNYPTDYSAKEVKPKFLSRAEAKDRNEMKSKR